MPELMTAGEGAPGHRGARPPWLRPVALAVVAVLHGLVLLALAWPDEPRSAALPPIEVEIVPQGDPVREAAPLGAEQASEARSEASQPGNVASAQPPAMADQNTERAPDPPREVAEDKAAQRPPEPSQLDASQTPPPPEATAEPRTPEFTTDPTPTLAPELRRPPTSEGELPPPTSRPRVSPPDKPTRAAEPKRRPRPDPEPTQAARREKRRLEEAAQRGEALRREREAERRREAVAQARERAAEREAERRQEAAAETRQRAAERATQARRAAAQAAARAGSSRGGGGARGPVTSSVSSAGYGAMVVAELNRRKRYPEAARAAGAQGVVVVSFVIGPSGRVAGHSITRSSGNAALDGAVNQMMAGVSLPPPPGGSFRASAPVRFSLAQ